jgi:hypothetical protein
MWGARGGRDIWCAWKRRGAEGGLAAGELRLLLPGRHSKVRGDLWMCP